MTGLGDVFAVVVTLIGVCFSLWAMIVVFALMFPTSARTAADRIGDRPVPTTLLGAAIVIFGGGFGLVLLNAPPPPVKLLGTTLLLIILGIGVIGAAGIGHLLAGRMQTLGAPLSPFAALSRASGMIAFAWLLPFLGWFLVGPLLLMASVGAGFMSLRPAREKGHASL